jgi:hypothetical protein
MLIDKGSRNGTRIDMIPLRAMEPRAIRSGSMILFGDLPFLFLSPKDLFTSMRSAGLVEPDTCREGNSWIR